MKNSIGTISDTYICLVKRVLMQDIGHRNITLPKPVTNPRDWQNDWYQHEYDKSNTVISCSKTVGLVRSRYVSSVR